MHELAICQALMDQVETIAKDNHAIGVVAVIVGIGPLSGVEAHLLKYAYPVASAGTIAEHAELVIENLPVQVSCKQCGKQSTVQPNKLVCTHCGDWQTSLVSGDELLLMSVELEKAAAIPERAVH